MIFKHRIVNHGTSIDNTTITLFDHGTLDEIGDLPVLANVSWFIIMPSYAWVVTSKQLSNKVVLYMYI